MAFTVSDCFVSYADLESRVKDYESANNVQLTNRDSRTLESAQKRVPKRVEGANSNLKYYSDACLWWKTIQQQDKGKQT